MNKQGCIAQLEGLRKLCMDWSPRWDKDVEALDMAIATLKETAQEVPVQEQSPIKVKVNIANLNEFNALLVDVTDKLTQLKNFKFKVEVEK